MTRSQEIRTASQSDENGNLVGPQKSWLLTCPECEHKARVPMLSRVKYCGICAGDNGRDVLMNREPSELPHDAVYGS